MASDILKQEPAEPTRNTLSHVETKALKLQRPTYFRKLVESLSARRGTWVSILLASLALNLCGLAAPRITQSVLDRVIPTGNLILLGQLLVLLLVMTAIQIALTLWRRLTLVRLSLRLDRQSLGDLCAHLLSLPLLFFKGWRPGDLLGRFHDHGHVRHLLVGGLTRTIIDGVMMVIYAAVMFAYSARLAILVLGLAGLFAAYTFWLGPILKSQHRRLMEDSAAQEAHVIEALVGINMVKALAVEGTLSRRWAVDFEKTLASNYRTQKLRQLLESGGAAIQFASTAVVLGYGATLVVQGNLTAGELVAFSLYAALALVPLIGLITLWDEVQQARAALERLQVIAAEEPEAPRTPLKHSPLPKLSGHVQVENVHFDYEPGWPSVLRGVSFEAFPGECIAIVGRTGSGKSTLARLLLGLYPSSRGRVAVDGRDLTEIDVAGYRRQVGTVLQENLLVTGTIAENIALGEVKVEDDRLISAASLVGLHEFVTALPKGYQTVVGELGLTLSGGQRQLISLARALYREPAILVLDEPTSALDRVSRQELAQSLPAILAGRTVFLITHQAVSDWPTNRILVLEGGVIVEDGSHEDLLTKKGVYHQLFTQP